MPQPLAKRCQSHSASSGTCSFDVDRLDMIPYDSRSLFWREFFLNRQKTLHVPHANVDQWLFLIGLGGPAWHFFRFRAFFLFALFYKERALGSTRTKGQGRVRTNARRWEGARHDVHVTIRACRGLRIRDVKLSQQRVSRILVFSEAVEGLFGG
jgi:hypothetical protein